MAWCEMGGTSMISKYWVFLTSFTNDTSEHIHDVYNGML